MTTWHTHDTLLEVLDFALPWAIPDDYYAEGCDAIVIANIGAAADTDELRRLISEQIGPRGNRDALTSIDEDGRRVFDSLLQGLNQSGGVEAVYKAMIEG